MEDTTDVSKARQDLAEKRQNAYKARHKAAIKIQRWYHSHKVPKADISSLHSSETVSDVSHGKLPVSSSKESCGNSYKISKDDSGLSMGHEAPSEVNHASSPGPGDQPIEPKTSLDEFVDNEVAIALALMHQKSFNSLTESQQERVRQVRAEVGPHQQENSHTTTNLTSSEATDKQPQSVIDPTPNVDPSMKVESTRPRGSKLKLPAVYVNRENSGLKLDGGKQKDSGTSENASLASEKEHLPQAEQNTAKQIHPNAIHETEQCEQESPLRVREHVQLSKVTGSQQGNPLTVTATEHLAEQKKNVKHGGKSFPHQNNTDIKGLHKAIDSSQPVMKINKPVQKNVQRTSELKVVKHSGMKPPKPPGTASRTKPLLHKQNIKQPSYAEKTTPKLPEQDKAISHSQAEESDVTVGRKRVHIQILDEHAQKHTTSLPDMVHNNEPTYTEQKGNRQSKIPIKASHPRQPFGKIYNRRECEESVQEEQARESKHRNEVAVSKSKSSDVQTEWDEPGTPEEDYTVPTLNQQLHKNSDGQYYADENQKEIETKMLPQRLTGDEKAHALINFAQELVISDFLAWKSSSKLLPSIGDRAEPHSLPDHTLVESTDDAQLSSRHDDIESLSTDHKVNRKSSQTHTQSPFHGVSHSPKQSPERNKRKSRPERPRKMNILSSPLMVDIGVQTDSCTDSEEGSLSTLENTPVHLPPPNGDGYRPDREFGTQKGKHRSVRIRSDEKQEFKKRRTRTQRRGLQIETDDYDLIDCEDEELGFSDHTLGGVDKPVHVHVPPKPIKPPPRRDTMEYFILQEQRDRRERKLIRSLKPPSLKPVGQKKQVGGYLNKFLHSDDHKGHTLSKSAPGGYSRVYQNNPSVLWYSGYNHTAPPSIVAGDSPLHLQRSHPVPMRILARKFSGEPYMIHKRRPRNLRPIQQPRNVQIPPLYGDPFQSLDSMYKHQYKHTKWM